jgi:hypothetical protein
MLHDRRHFPTMYLIFLFTMHVEVTCCMIEDIFQLVLDFLTSALHLDLVVTSTCQTCRTSQ